LYKDEFISLKVCPTCGLSPFKKKVDENNVDEEIYGPLLKCCGTFP